MQSNNNLEAFNSLPQSVDQGNHHQLLFTAAYGNSISPAAGMDRQVADHSKPNGSAGMENSSPASHLYITDISQLPPTEGKIRVLENANRGHSHADGLHSPGDKNTKDGQLVDLNEVYKRRDEMVKNLSPEQKRQYDEEKRTLENYRKCTELDGIAFPMDKPPALPLHDAIERLTNPSGLTDMEQLRLDAEKANPSILDRVRKFLTD